MDATTNPKSFTFRLRSTIAQLERETQQGVEDWTSTIARMRDLLPQVEAEETASPEVEVEVIVTEIDEFPEIDEDSGPEGEILSDSVEEI